MGPEVFGERFPTGLVFPKPLLSHALRTCGPVVDGGDGLTHSITGRDDGGRVDPPSTGLEAVVTTVKVLVLGLTRELGWTQQLSS
jgi:hypothetical protein